MRRLIVAPGIALATALGACAEDPVEPAQLQRLLDEAGAWQGGGTREVAVVDGEWRPALRLASGVTAQRSLDLPPQPCWLVVRAAPVGGKASSEGPEGRSQESNAKDADSVQLDVWISCNGEELPVSSSLLRPSPLEGSYPLVRVDLGAWAGQRVDCVFRGVTADSCDWWLAHPHVEPQEVFDNRYRSVVLVVCDREAGKILEGDGLESTFDTCVESDSSSVGEARLGELLREVSQAMADSGRECLAYAGRAPASLGLADLAGYDAWVQQELYGVDPSGDRDAAQGALLRCFGRPRAQSLFVTVITDTREPQDLEKGIVRILDQLRADSLFDLALVAVLDVGDAGVGQLFIKRPRGTTDFESGEVSVADYAALLCAMAEAPSD